MTRSEFINALKIQTSDTAIFGTMDNLKSPPGRTPSNKDKVLSDWYNSLAATDQASVNATIREAAELAVFSFLCVLDSVAAIENGSDKGSLRLAFEKNGMELLLNDQSDEYLHDSYNALCQTSEPVAPNRPETRMYEINSVQQLRSSQTSTDGLDLHSMSYTDPQVPVDDKPAIALPRNEHRKLEY